MQLPLKRFRKTLGACIHIYARAHEYTGGIRQIKENKMPTIGTLVQDMQVFFALILFWHLFCKFEILSPKKALLKEKNSLLASKVGKCYTTSQLKRMKL